MDKEMVEWATESEESFIWGLQQEDRVWIRGPRSISDIATDKVGTEAIVNPCWK